MTSEQELLMHDLWREDYAIEQGWITDKGKRERLQSQINALSRHENELVRQNVESDVALPKTRRNALSDAMKRGFVGDAIGGMATNNGFGEYNVE